MPWLRSSGVHAMQRFNFTCNVSDIWHKTFVNVTNEKVGVPSIDCELLHCNIYNSQCLTWTTFHDMWRIFAYYNQNFTCWERNTVTVSLLGNMMVQRISGGHYFIDSFRKKVATWSVNQFCRKWPGSSCRTVRCPAVLKLKQVKSCTALNQFLFLFSGVSEATEVSVRTSSRREFSDW